VLSKQTIPEIRIRFSFLLFEKESPLLAKARNIELLSSDEYINKTALYQKAWRQKQKDILRAMQEVVDLTFYKPVIDVTLAPAFIPISTPLIIGFSHDPDQLVDVLTHELWHILFTDNNVTPNANRKLLAHWQKLYGKDHKFRTLVHIPVHAGLKYIYLDVLNAPERLEKDKEFCKKLDGYTEAWDYVETNDYHQILGGLKKMYKTLQT